MEMCSSLSPVDRFIKGYVSAIWKSNHGAHFFFFYHKATYLHPVKVDPIVVLSVQIPKLFYL